MAVRGYLTVLVTQASSRTKANEVVWDESFKEGFVKVEVRGGPRNVKVQSTLKPVSEGMLEWNETLNLEVLQESRELRIVLCREQKSANRIRSAVVAACGIFVEDILDAVPIDKWFEMFKPAAAGEGGYIRVHMSFSEHNPTQARNASPTKPLAPVAPSENENDGETRPGIAESFAPQLSGVTSELPSDLTGMQKENRPPLSQGSQNTPSSAAPQRKTDEAHSREISPDVPEPEPEVEEVAEVEEEIQPQPVTRTREAHEVYLQRRSIAPQRKKKSKGKTAVKFLGTLLVVAAAGAAAVYAKQELDKRPRTQHEILVDDDLEGTSKNSE